MTMSRTQVFARLGLWRLTRHPAVGRLYDRLERAGAFAAQLDAFERETDTGIAVDPPADIQLSTARADEGLPDHLMGEPVAPGDTVVRATRQDETVGCCCLSDRPVYVPELRQRVSFAGTYLWRLFVESSARGCGIGTAIIGGALTAGREAFGRDRLTALIAPDNLPSRRAFARLGFRPVDRFTTVGIRGWRLDRRRPLATAPG